MLRFFQLTLLSITICSASLFCEIKAVVFDYGGVIGDVEQNVVESFVQKTLKVDSVEARQLILEAKKQTPQIESFWENIAKEKGIELPQGWRGPFLEHCLQCMYEIPGSMAIVEELKQNGIQVGMLSNITKNAAKCIRTKGYYTKFDPVLLSYEIGVDKPDKKAYELLVERLALKPQEIFFIDDRIENVEAARSCGLNAHHFKNAAKLKRDLVAHKLLPELHVTLDDHTLWYETLGNPTDTPLLLISGATTSGRYWSDSFCLDLVKKGYYVIRYDHPDVGASSSYPVKYSLQHLAQDAISVLKAAKIQKAHLVGHSMGGYVSQVTAALFPQHVESITVVSAGPIGMTDDMRKPYSQDEMEIISKTFEYLYSPRPQGDTNEVVEYYHKSQKYTQGGYHADPQLVTEYVHDLHTRSKHSHKNSLKHVDLMAEFMNTMDEWTPLLEKIRCPVLVIQGGQDPIVLPSRGGLALHKALEHSELLFLPKMGHMLLNKELQHIVAERIDQFQKESVTAWNTQKSNSLAASS